MNRFEPKEFRLSALVQRHAMEMTYDGLARAIAEANLPVKDRKVDRRKLKKIVDRPEEVTLSMRELRALDVYFARHGEGLADKPIFERVGILESLVENKEVTFLIGSTPREKERRNDLSRWDTRSLAALLHDLGRNSNRLQYRIEDVLQLQPDKETKVSSQDWYRLIKKPDGPSLISIGSPRACLASEVMLAEIFALKPFKKPDPFSKRSPFHFVWSPDASSEFPSSFTLRGEDLASLDPKISELVCSSKSWAFHWRKKVFEVKRNADRDSMFGVIVAQRRSSGQVWLVCAGITGPATLAASQLVRDVAIALPRPESPDAHGHPIVAPVIAEVGRRQTKQKGDNRILTKQGFYQKPLVLRLDANAG